MKRMKKFFAMLLALTMVLGMTMTASAKADVKGDYDDTGVIEVKGITAEAGVKVDAYKIIEARYDNNGNFSGYQFLYPDAGIDKDVKDAWGQIVVTQEHLNKIIAADKLADERTGLVLKAGDAETTYVEEEGNKYFTYDRHYEMQPEGEYYKATVQVGAYLVMITGAEAAIYNPVVVSVNYVNQNGKNAIYDGAVGVEEIFEIVTGEAWVKKSENPTITKTEEDGEGNTLNDGLYGNSVDAGNDVDYTITIDQIPYYGGDHPEFKVQDYMFSELSYVTKEEIINAGTSEEEKVDVIDMKVKVGDTELVKNVDYTVGGHTNQMLIDFVVDTTDDGVDNPVYTLNKYQGQSVTITYSATLFKDAKDPAAFNNNAHENHTFLIYTRDSKVDSDDVLHKTEEAITYTYTFDLTEKLLKTGEDNDAAKLAGATFVLYVDEECTEEYSNSFSVEKELSDGTKHYAYVSDSNGNLNIKGIEAGTYWLKEVEAPAGYSVNTHTYKIEVFAEYETEDDQDNYKIGQLTNWGIKVDDVETEKLTIPNTKLINLPSTGGIGTTIFTVAGCGIMIAAAFFFFASRKKEN